MRGRLDHRDLQRRLDELLAEHDVPGAVVGVLERGETHVCAGGVLRRPGGAPVSGDSLFLIASITKVWTATLVMQLVDEGRVELNEPVNRYLEPRLRLGDADAADAVTVAQLLTHSGGFYGDAGEPPERGDQAVAVTVASYGELPQLHHPGNLFSYSNAGYNVLGRLVECLTATTWDEALRQRLIEPLGLGRTFTSAEHAMTFPHAVGHEPARPGSLELAPVDVWLDPRGGGPCGSTLSTTVADLLTFAQLHIDDGLARDGRRVLSAWSAREMRRRRIDQPDPSASPGWGLGWAIERDAEPSIVEHGGNTCGQQSELVVIPECELAICVLANGDPQGLLRARLLDWLLGELVGVTRPTVPPSVLTGPSPDVTVYTGTYGIDGELTIVVSVAPGGELEAEFLTGGEIARSVEDFRCALVPCGGTSFRFTMPPLTEPITATFVSEPPALSYTHIAIGLRALPRRGPGAAPA